MTPNTTTHNSGHYEKGRREGAQMSGASHTVDIMNANTPPAAKPPQPGSAEHWAAWLDKYGDDYATDDERRAAYQDLRPISPA
ncbi:hypothetical protein [Mycobacterium intracellulare]|uniref:hypothetical protein n=1 Tax=Mycobacterium intracellulare TaxID=1767 RepID=UPI001E39DE18|nr:hypothetical protein [Mycobacterium intracellulare]